MSGYSKFGSYTGTGTAGVSVTTGFKPRWVLIKETSQSQHWFIYDTQRGVTNILWASSSASESQIGSGDGSNQNAIQIDSDGFTIPHTLSGTNRNGSTYFYAAFADRPGNNFDANNLVASVSTTNSKGFSAVGYTGTNSTNSISSLDFQPDFVWIKNRDQSEKHALSDSVRDTGKVLYSNSSSQEDSGSTYSNRFASFDSNGFTVGSNHTTTNSSGDDFIAYCWKAGGAATSNTDGSITANVSANDAYGFSIIQFLGNATAGATVGHGLSSAPELVIGKNRGGGDIGESGLSLIILVELNS